MGLKLSYRYDLIKLRGGLFKARLSREGLIRGGGGGGLIQKSAFLRRHYSRRRLCLKKKQNLSPKNCQNW